MGFSVYLLGFLPWGVLSPLNIIKLQLNTVSPMAHIFVPKETEQCQAACGIARMWATLFWSLQFISALSFVFVHYHREQTGLVYMGIAAKLVVGVLLLKAYLTGVINWPIGLGGACFDWTLALLFALELRGGGGGGGYGSSAPWANGRLSFMEEELSSQQLRKERLSLRNGELPASISDRMSGREEDAEIQRASRSSFQAGTDKFKSILEEQSQTPPSLPPPPPSPPGAKKEQ